MSLNRRNFLTASAAIAVGIPFARLALAQSSSGEPRKGGTLVASIFPEPTFAITTVNNVYPNAALSSNVFDGLLTYDADLKPRPSLATSWQTSDDNLTISFRLREDVRWHDGQPFTAADVKFSLMEAWKKLHSRGRITFANVIGADTPDDHTIVLHLSRPSPLIMLALSASESLILPCHLYEGTDIITNPHNIAPVGTGAFRLTKWVKGDHIQLERNSAYWDKGKPYLDKIILRSIPDEASRAAAFETEEILYAPYDPVPFADVDRLRSNANLTIETHGYDWQAQIQLLEFNLRNPILKDLRVRQAILHAISRTELINVVLFGLGKPATSPVPSVSDYFTKDIKQYGYDPAESERLLDEAGYPRKNGGVRFSLRIDRQAFPVYVNSSEFLRQSLEKVGIHAEVVARDNAGFIKAVYSQYDFDINNLIISAYKEPQMGIFRLYYSKSAQAGVPYAMASGYNSPEMDKIIEAIQGEIDPAKRKSLFTQFQKLALDELPTAPLYEVEHYTIYNKRLKGVETNPDSAVASLKNVWLEG